MSRKIISYPKMGNYSIPVYYLLSNIFPKIEIMKPNLITKETIELGTKYSPDFICTPFKYTLGTFIESLENGSNILIQAGGGCRYGYYSELQDKILKDLGYKFTYINLVSKGKANIKDIYKKIKQIDSKVSPLRIIYYLIITIQMVKYMDKTDEYIRKNIGFEVEKGSFENTYNTMLQEFSKVKNIFQLNKIYKKYDKKIKQILINKPNKCLKVGIVGELYTIMEPFANYFLETKLAQSQIEVTRFTNAYYLLFQKKRKVKQYLKQVKKYIRYPLGADAADNIARVKQLCEEEYDGIIHIKSSFCTPEIGAMPIINKICKEHNVPVIFFSFDSSTAEAGIETRLEAFIDMIKMKE